MEMERCATANATREQIFSYLASLHFAPCTLETPVVVHRWYNAGLGNALGQLLLSAHFAALHGRALVVHTDVQAFVWLNNSGITSDDLIWPSSCQQVARSLPHGVKAFHQAIQMQGIFCPTYGCPWAHALPPAFDGQLCVVTWYSHLLDFLLRPSRALMDMLDQYAAPHCDPNLCGHQSGAAVVGSGLAGGPRRERQSRWRRRHGSVLR